MEQWQKNMEQKLDTLNNGFNQLRDALIGNDMTKGMGWADRIEELEITKAAQEKRIQRLEQRELQIVTIVAVIVAIGVVVQWFFGIYSTVKK